MAEGLAAPRGNRGIVVSELSTDTVRALYELRETLETKAATLAANRGDAETFTRLAARFDAARYTLGPPAADESEDYYALTGALDAALDAHCGNLFLAAALSQLRPQLDRARRIARDHPQRLAETTAEHASICRAIAARNPALAAAAITVHLNNSLQHLLENSA